MVAEIFIKNRLDALLGPIIGKLSVGNAPLIKAKGSQACFGPFTD